MMLGVFDLFVFGVGLETWGTVDSLHIHAIG